MSEVPNLSDEQLERILEAKPDFVQQYFLRKATASLVEAWMSKKRRKQKLSIQEISRVPRLSQGSSTNLVLKPLAGSLAGSSTKLKQLYGSEDADDPPAKQDECKENHVSVKPKKDYTALSEMELFMELIRDISNELDINTLSHKILLHVSILTNADRSSLFLVKGTHSEDKDKRFLVSRLFDVTAESTVEDSLKPEGDEIIIPIGVGIAGHAALTGDTINIRDVYKDSRFNVEIDKHTGYRTNSMLCMPIKSHDGQVVGVAQLINKKTGDHYFTEKDEEVAKNYLTFCGIGLTNAQLFEMSVQEFKRNQVLLSLAKNIFEQTDSVDTVVRRIMAQAQELLKCERCTVYIIDLEIEDQEEDVCFSKVFDLMTGDEENKQIEQKGADESYDILSGIATLVARSGETMNISDKNNNSFSIGSSQNDKQSKSHFILCVPIRNHEGVMIGVGQLVNKINGHPFTENDENMFEAFGIFCGLGIHNAQLYEKACIMLAKQMVAMEVLSYHASASPEDVEKLSILDVKPSEEYDLCSFGFDDIEMSDLETCAACMRMFYDMEVLEKFHVPTRVAARFVLTVKKNYRPVLYHNWRHAFNVAQTMFAMLTSGQMRTWFTDLEIFVLIVGCLCHDLDHRGTNNTYQVKADSPIAKLYSTSTMEHHHFDHSIMILNSEGNNIFAGLNSDQYRKAIKTLEHSILSTDLALYFKKRGVFQKLVDEGNTDWKREENRIALRAMLMTACDVAAITKPWDVQQRVAELVASEFFEQGDLERQQLQAEPIPMMDRHKKHELPKMQVGFIDFVCLPIYEMIYHVNEYLKPMYDGVKSNREHWNSLTAENNAEKSQEPNPTRKQKSEANVESKKSVCSNGVRIEITDVPTSRPQTKENKKPSVNCSIKDRGQNLKRSKVQEGKSKFCVLC